jgi:hypothetical protein
LGSLNDLQTALQSSQDALDLTPGVQNATQVGRIICRALLCPLNIDTEVWTTERSIFFLNLKLNR